MSRRYKVGRIVPLVLAITLTPVLMATGNAQHEVLPQDLPPGSVNSDDLPSNGNESEMEAIRREVEQGRKHGFYNGVKTWHDQDVISYWAYRLAVPWSRDLRKEICDRWRAASQDFPMTGNISVFGAEMSLNKTCGIKR